MKEYIDINSGWELCRLPGHGRLEEGRVSELTRGACPADEEWVAVETMPAQVQEILIAAGRIEDPLALRSAEACKWVAESDWVYRAAFARPDHGNPVCLHCLGLDTLADVYLNGRHLAWHDNMYLPLCLDVTDLLEEENVLLLHFWSPYSWLADHPLPEDLQGLVQPNRQLRKPHEDFNAFNGMKPYYTPIGVYDRVRLECVDRAEIDLLDIDVDLYDEYARAAIGVTLLASGDAEEAEARVRLVAPDGQVIGEAEAECDAGLFGCEFTVLNPQLWWPRHYGDQPLYEIQAELLCEGEVVDRATRRIGVREVQLDGRLDCVVNGRHVKLWGTNFTPIRGHSHVWDPERLRILMDLAENANFTSLRIWGPGAPYGDDLYDEADRRGILLWDEFYHTWGMYPDDDAFQDTCRREAEHHVRRLKHHPSIILWCGGNEHTHGAWMDHPGKRIRGAVLYEKVYREVCRRLDPARYYHPNSPIGGAFPNDPLEGDSHAYQHKWFVPGEQYGILFTENTRMSSPLVKSLKRHLGPDAGWEEGFTGRLTRHGDPVMPEKWLDMTLGPQVMLVRLGPIEDFYDTGDSPEGLVYRLGAAHGRYLRDYAERYRRGRPWWDPDGPRRCMGLYQWKYNNTWPMIYSNLVDYYLECNMAYYALRRAYAPVLISIDIDDFIHIWVVNDTAAPVSGTLVVQQVDILAGRLAHDAPEAVSAARRTAAALGDEDRVMNELQVEVYLEPGESRIVADLNEFAMIDRNHAICARLYDEDGELIARNHDFATEERRLAFPEARLDVQVVDGAVEITADRFARCVELAGGEDGEQFGWRFEDNFFDLMAGETRRVGWLGDFTSGTIRARSRFSPHEAVVTF